MSDFDEFYEELWSEAEAEGPDVAAGMRALASMYRVTLDLRDARIARGLTQQQLSDLTGVGQPEISRIEGGQTNVTVATLGALAGPLGLELRLLPAPER